MGVLAGMFLSFPYSPLWLPGTIGSESPLPFYRVGGSIETQKKNRAIREIRAKKQKVNVVNNVPKIRFQTITPISEEDKLMKENGLGRLFVRNLIMAIPWGIISLVVFLIVMVSIKQQVREGIEYTMTNAIHGTVDAAFNYRVVTAVKKNIKEGVEFMAKVGKHEIKALLNDPQVKQDIKEALEYSGQHLR